jgi:dTDP-4-dehydrorhamnose reductase
LSKFNSLLDWFLGQNNSTIRGFNRAIYSGVTTNHLAALVGDVIDNYPNLFGLYQVASKPITKYDLLCLLRDAYKLNIEIVPDNKFACDRSMNGEKLRRATNYVCPSWPELADELVADLSPYYKNYK